MYLNLLGNGGRTSIRSGCRSYNGETSRGREESMSSSFVETMETYFRSVLPAPPTFRKRSGGDVEVLGPPDSGTVQAYVLVTFLLLHGPEEPGTALPWWILDETRWNSTGKVVVRI